MTRNHATPLSMRVSAPRQTGWQRPLSVIARRPATQVRLPYGRVTKMIAPRIAPKQTNSSQTRGNDAPARTVRAPSAAHATRTTRVRQPAPPAAIKRTRAGASPQSVRTQLRTRALARLNTTPTGGAAPSATPNQRQLASPTPTAHEKRRRHSAGPAQTPQYSRRESSAQMQDLKKPEIDLGDELREVDAAAARRERIDAFR